MTISKSLKTKLETVCYVILGVSLTLSFALIYPKQSFAVTPNICLMSPEVKSNECYKEPKKEIIVYTPSDCKQENCKKEYVYFNIPSQFRQQPKK